VRPPERSSGFPPSVFATRCVSTAPPPVHLQWSVGGRSAVHRKVPAHAAQGNGAATCRPWHWSTANGPRSRCCLRLPPTRARLWRGRRWHGASARPSQAGELDALVLGQNKLGFRATNGFAPGYSVVIVMSSTFGTLHQRKVSKERCSPSRLTNGWRGVFTSVADLGRKLRKYIRAYSKSARPFRWTYSDPTRRIRSNKITGTAY